MATTTLITIPVYAINGTLIDRNLYPYGMLTAFAGASIQAQPNAASDLNGLQACRQAGAALVYSKVLASQTPGTVFWSNLTVTQIISAANA